MQSQESLIMCVHQDNIPTVTPFNYRLFTIDCKLQRCCDNSKISLQDLFQIENTNGIKQYCPTPKT